MRRTGQHFILFLIRKLLKGIIPGSIVIVYQRNQGKLEFLILKVSSSNNVVLPGGSISWWENYEQTAKRELLEETGINANSLKELPIIHRFRYKKLPFRPKSEQHVFLYLLPKNKSHKLHSKEVLWFKWVTATEAINQLSHKELVETFKKALAYIN